MGNQRPPPVGSPPQAHHSLGLPCCGTFVSEEWLLSVGAGTQTPGQRGGRDPAKSCQGADVGGHSWARRSCLCHCHMLVISTVEELTGSPGAAAACDGVEVTKDSRVWHVPGPLATAPSLASLCCLIPPCHGAWQGQEGTQRPGVTCVPTGSPAPWVPLHPPSLCSGEHPYGPGQLGHGGPCTAPRHHHV